MQGAFWLPKAWGLGLWPPSPLKTASGGTIHTIAGMMLPFSSGRQLIAFAQTGAALQLSSTVYTKTWTFLFSSGQQSIAFGQSRTTLFLVQWLLLWTSHRFNTFIFHLDTLYYIILGKGCHILYVFGLISTVCSHVVVMHLSSYQVAYYFMKNADLYNSFLLRLHIRSF